LRLAAFWLQGAALAVVGATVVAEQPFRLLLRAKPDFVLPPSTPPRIAAVFRKVQVEEAAMAEELRAMERLRLVASLSLDAELPAQGRGGEPVSFALRLHDPLTIVSSVHLHYRRRGEAIYSALAMTSIDDENRPSTEAHQPSAPTPTLIDKHLRAVLPAELTESAAPYALESYIAVNDGAGESLRTLAEPTAPHITAMEAGRVPAPEPLYRSPWLWTAAAVTVAALGAGVYAVVHSRPMLPRTDTVLDLR
jgi:hypothetical protein